MKLKVALAGVLVTFALADATAVLGHASLVASDPAAGSTISTGEPHKLTATFDEELTPNGSAIVVQDSTGTQVATGAVSAGDATSMAADMPSLTEGEYEVLWTAVTADDNAVERGTYTFTVGQVAASIPPNEQKPDPNASTADNNNVLLAVVPVVLIALAIAGYLIYRNRRR